MARTLGLKGSNRGQPTRTEARWNPPSLKRRRYLARARSVLYVANAKSIQVESPITC